ncbi:MAG: hypothetical protein A2V93_01015 [Ignavibacteria bacterium RBG_16_34_14]|nr:MAG: hypothetical protein A2V93_01015 [Ignavibacteria bacterium RBG_16_34_14]
MHGTFIVIVGRQNKIIVGADSKAVNNIDSIRCKIKVIENRAIAITGFAGVGNNFFPENIAFNCIKTNMDILSASQMYEKIIYDTLSTIWNWGHSKKGWKFNEKDKVEALFIGFINNKTYVIEKIFFPFDLEWKTDSIIIETKMFIPTTQVWGDIKNVSYNPDETNDIVFINEIIRNASIVYPMEVSLPVNIVEITSTGHCWIQGKENCNGNDDCK